MRLLVSLCITGFSQTDCLWAELSSGHGLEYSVHQRSRKVTYCSSSAGAQLRGGWRVLKHPRLKKVCPVIRPDPMTFLLGRVLALALLWTLPLLHYSLLKLTRIRIPACLYFKIHRQLTIVEVLWENTLLMSVADIHVN